MTAPATSARAKPRVALAIFALAGVAVAAVALVSAYRSRAADEGLRGQYVAVTVPSRALALKLPAFLAAYGAPRFVDADATIGFVAGDADRGNFVAVALSPADAEPFLAPGFPDWLAESYLTCLATADSAAGRGWWAPLVNEEILARPYKLKYAVARNTIPLVSRVCLAGTNGVAAINVRIVGGLSRGNMQRFAEELEEMFRSLVVEEDLAKQRLGLRGE